MKQTISCMIYSVSVFVCSVVYAEQDALPQEDSSPKRTDSPQGAPKESKERSAEERFWSNLKGIPIGPFKIDLGAGLRLRGELQDNFDVKQFGDQSRDAFLLERLRIKIGIHVTNDARVFVQGQDAHELGCNLSNADFANGSPYNNHFDLRQAFFEWNRIGETPVGFKVGRQSIAFADNRLMGPGEWGNVGRYTWDAIALTWRSQFVDVDALYALRVKHDPTGFDYQHFDYDVLGLFSTFPIDVFSVHAFYFLKMNNFHSDEEPSDGDFHRHSPGLSLEATFDFGIDTSLGVVPQLGEWSSSSVFALGGYVSVGYNAPIYGSPRVGLHYAYGSGDSDPNDGVIRTFDGIFGAVDSYYGRMNVFAWMNLHDIQLALSGNPLKFININADYHLFFLAEQRDAWYYASGQPQRQDLNGASGRIVGHEIDFVVGVKASAYARFQAGYALFVPSAFVRKTGPDGLAHWGFVQGGYEF